MTSIFWPQFGVLFAAALVGAAALTPYSLRLLSASGHAEAIKRPLGTLLLLSFIQTAVLSVIAIGVGLLAGRAINLGAPYIEALFSGIAPARSLKSMLLFAIGLGVLIGAVMLVADLLLLPHWPKRLLDTARATTIWENFTASFYGGINEELLMRLFGLSVLLWLVSRIWHTPANLPTSGAFWTANVVIAILFGLSHLPATRGLLGSVSPFLIGRSLILNVPIGLACGWLFFVYGIEGAIVAHFSADIVYHVIGTMVLQQNPLGIFGRFPSWKSRFRAQYTASG